MSPVLKEIENSFSESWNRIVNILEKMFETETVLINSVDNSKIQVIKSGGEGEKYFDKNKEYSLQEVYCEKVVKDKEMLEINNAAGKDRWKGYAAVKAGLISYLGFPILNPEGEVVGTICVEDNNERYFTETEKDLIYQFKEVIENQIKQLDLTRQLEENLERGKQLHKQYLPSHFPEVDELDFATYYQAAEKLGGDFYDVLEQENKILFYISDVSGHDLSSAMLNIFLKENIHSYLIYHKEKENYLSPADIIDHVTEHFREKDFPPDYFISIIVGVLDLKNFRVRLSNAGFQYPPLITGNDGSISTIFCKGRPVTILNGNIDYPECSYFLQPGDTLCLNTDGLFEQTNIKAEFYGEKRVVKLLYENADLGPETILNKIYNDFFNFKEGTRLQDDLTSLLIQRKK
ncbi:MAG: SpoIIE family protein phosphatase [Bacillota bacterium]